MIKVLQVYDSTITNAGINIEIMNINRHINHDLCIFDFLSSWKRTPNFDKEIVDLGGTSYYVTNETSIKNPIKFIFSVKRFMKQNAHKYDIIHLHTGQMCFPYLYYAKKYGIKRRFVHAHSVSFGNTRITSFRNSLLLAPMKKLATDYVACSEEAANTWFIRRGIKDYCIINNGVAIDKFQCSTKYREEFRQQFGIREEQQVIVHISNMSRLKNIPFLIDVFYKVNTLLKDSILVLVGKEEIPEEIKEQLVNFGLEKNVINYGITNDVSKVINGSDICLMPSIDEGFGLVPIECQCCETPVLISCGFPKIIDASEYAYRVPLDIDIWVNKTIEILKNNIDKSKFNKNELELFNIKNVSEKLLMLYINR